MATQNENVGKQMKDRSMFELLDRILAKTPIADYECGIQVIKFTTSPNCEYNQSGIPEIEIKD